MKIIRAEHLGMCFGVRDAIALAREVAKTEPVTVLGQLVHNPVVLERMQRAGVRFAAEPEEADTGRALITAHGASDQFRRRAERTGLRLTDTTCPLVTHAHRMLHSLVNEGCFPVVIGRRDHVEVRGLTDDLTAFAVVLTEAEVDALPQKERYGVCAQTTQPIHRVRTLVDRLRRRFPDSEVRFADTVCQPTKQRQSAAESVAQAVEVMVVVGGANSNNTAELSATCRLHCRRVYQVERPEELHPGWFAGVKLAGLTAGTSTPDDLIDAVEVQMMEMAAQSAAVVLG